MTKTRTIQILRGTTAQNDAYTGSAGELTMDTTTNELRLHDGSTSGGHIIGSGSGIDYVVEKQDPTSSNNYTWYRKYKSGWVEQGQRTTTVSGNTQTVNLPVEMSDTNYDLQITPHYMSAGSAATVNVVTITTTSFTVWGNQNGQAGFWTVPFSYTVCGMVAS